MKLNVFWLFIFTQTALASSEFDNVSLEELMDVQVTSITKMPMSLNKSPVTAYVISQDEINRKGYRFLTDILKNVPDFHVVNLGVTEKATTEIYIRGVFANDKITVLVDGIKIKAPTGEPTTFFSIMPLLDVKQVEISLGSASSIYGADAMLGTINLVTKSGEDLNGFKIKTTGGSQDTAEVQVAAGKKINDDINVSLAGSFHRSASENLKQNYPEIYGKLNKTDLSEQNHNIHFKANYKDLTVSYYRLQNKNNNSISFNPAAPISYDYSGKAFWDITNQVANATYNLEINPFWQAKSSLSYESTELSDESSYRAWNATAPVSWLGDAIRFSETVAYLHGDINWLNGIELSFLNSQPKNQYTDLSIPKYNVHYQNYAVFSQLNYDLTDNLTLNGSVRMDADSRYSPTFNPRVGFSWQAIKTLRFFGAWGTSYIAPSPYLIYETWNKTTDFIFHRPNLNLQPENLETYEMGFNAEPFKNNTFKASGFYTNGKNIVRVVNNVFTGKPNSNDNLATSKSYGFQVGDSQNFNNGVDADFNYTFTKGEQDAEKLNKMVDMTNVPEHMIKSNVTYSLDNLTLRFTGRWFDKIGTHESNLLYKGQSMHGTTIFDTNLHYAFPLNMAEFSIDLGVNNLLDTKYYTVGVNDNFAVIPLPDGNALSGGLSRLPQETRRLYFTVGFSY
ncbi:MAG: TonB-dependent receptor [Methylococcaceae bacterium]